MKSVIHLHNVPQIKSKEKTFVFKLLQEYGFKTGQFHEYVEVNAVISQLFQFCLITEKNERPCTPMTVLNGRHL